MTEIVTRVNFTYGATAISIPQTHQFRVRRLDIPLPGLPRDLDPGNPGGIGDG